MILAFFCLPEQIVLDYLCEILTGTMVHGAVDHEEGLDTLKGKLTEQAPKDVLYLLVMTLLQDLHLHSAIANDLEDVHQILGCVEFRVFDHFSR